MPQKWKSRLAELLTIAPQRKAIDPSLGSKTELGDINKFVPVPYRSLADNTTVQWGDLDTLTSGEYDHESHTIRKNALHRQASELSNTNIDGVPLNVLGSGPPTLPHELAHAIYPNLSSAEKSEWWKVWDRNLRKNKALGQYQYASDSSHAFADAFAAWTVNPAMLKNLVPEVYNFLAKIATPKGGQTK